MDLSILEILEKEDEDDVMHSGADMEAMQAALTRLIEGDTSASLPSDSHDETEQVPCGSFSGTPQQQPNDVPEELDQPSIQQKQSQAFEQIAGQGFETTRMQISQNAIPDRESGSESQCSKLKEMSERQITDGNQMLPFAVFMPSLLPQLDKDRGMQVDALYAKYKRKEITKKEFIRHLQSIVGIPVLRCTAFNLLSQVNTYLQMKSNKSRLPSESSTQQKYPTMPSFPAPVPQFVGQLQKLGPNSPANISHATAPVVSMLTDPSYSSIQNYAQNPREMGHQSGSHIAAVGSQIFSSTNQDRDCSLISEQGLNAQQKLHSASYSAADVNTSGSSSKSQPHDSQIRQLTYHRSTESTTLRGSTQGINMLSGPKFESQNSINDPIQLRDGSVSHVSANPVPHQVPKIKESNPLPTEPHIKQKPVGHAAGVQDKSLATPQGPLVKRNGTPATSNDKPLEKQGIKKKPLEKHDVLLSSPNSSVTSPAGVNARTPQLKPSVGKKKPRQALGSPPPLPSKRRKVSLNDVAVLSGVNLQEEEERLFSGHKVESRFSEASRRILHEEERGILLKIPLQKKLAEIMARRGVKNISNDVERFLSLTVEERMRGLIRNLIRLSKQRANAEKPIHRTQITSDVWQQIVILNCKAKEEWEEEKNEGQEKSLKTNKDGDNRMRAAAANVAARAAVGGDDMLSKWQFMAEEACRKREGDMYAVSSFQAGAVRKFGRKQVIMGGTISARDVIAVLEREPQMCRSTLLYSLYDRIRK